MGETVYANTGKMFYKIKQKNFRNSSQKPYWTTKIMNASMGECYRNFSGGCLPCYLAEVVETATCKDEETFIERYKKDIYSYLIDGKSPYGWLSPSAEFFPCDYTHHQEVAELYLGKQEMELEKEGWLKVFKEWDSNDAVYAKVRPSSAQLEWLNDNDVKYSKFACYQ